MKLEKEVKKDINNKLKILERFNHIIWYERLQSGMMVEGNLYMHLCRKGTPDYIVLFINKKNTITVMFVEIKREGVFKTSKGAQTEFINRYCKLHEDIIHIIAQSVDDMTSIIYKLSKNKLDEIEFNA